MGDTGRSTASEPLHIKRPLALFDVGELNQFILQMTCSLSFRQPKYDSILAGEK